MGEPEFIDAESDQSSFSAKNEISFKMIALEHFRKVCSLGSVEFRGGYWQNKSVLTKGGVTMTEKSYIPDTREEYCNAVDVLYDLLMPHIKDKIYKEFDEELDKILNELEELRKEYLEKTEEDDKEIMSAEAYKGKDKKVVEEYKFLKLRKQRILFQKLSCFLKKKKYLEKGFVMD